MKSIWRRLRGKRELSPELKSLANIGHVQCRCWSEPYVAVDCSGEESHSVAIIVRRDDGIDGRSGNLADHILPLSIAGEPLQLEQAIETAQFIREHIARSMGIPITLLAPDNPPAAVDDNPNAVLG